MPSSHATATRSAAPISSAVPFDRLEARVPSRPDRPSHTHDFLGKTFAGEEPADDEDGSSMVAGGFVEAIVHKRHLPLLAVVLAVLAAATVVTIVF